jgi:DNA-binding FadR family transcriptional regulator
VTPEEAKERVAAQKARICALETEVARLASTQPTPVLLAMLRTLVERVCAAQGPNFTTFNKIKFYESVIFVLRENGIL